MAKGAWRDNVFIERLWRTVKYEEVYLRRLRQRCRMPPRFESGAVPSNLYNRRRPHSSLSTTMTPDQAYFGSHRMLPVRLAA